ncbi:FecR domain-containing protein [Methylobacillus pratensis]
MSVAAKPGHAVLQAAAEWYVQLQAEQPTAQQLQRFEAWLHADASHRHAWSKVQRLEQQFGLLPADIAVPALQNAQTRRRTVLKMVALLAITAPAGWGAYEYRPWRPLTAGYSTATGEIRQVRLADGGILFLNTATSLDIDYGPQQRIVQLHEGEVLVETAADAADRPFIVHTRHGAIRALGTRFTVRTDRHGTQAAVLEHAVKITLAGSDSESVLLQAGQQARFNAAEASAPWRLHPHQDAWIRGVLVADDQPLGEFIAQLARYRPGLLRCDPGVADLRVSGAFRLQDTDEALHNLAVALPVRLVYRTRYWVTVMPRR